jgi:hypothetical protein
MSFFSLSPVNEVVPLFQGTLIGSNTQTFYQDPKLKGSKPLYPSENQKGGIEFTYSWWMMINQYTRQTPATIFIKGYPRGDKSSVFCPNVQIQNRDGENQMFILLNTYAADTETILIKNMPIANWVHCGLVVKNQAVYVYINGQLVKSQKITGILRQNFGPLTVGPDGGFPGLIADLTYYRRALSPVDIARSADTPPNKKIIGVSANMPPYLSKSWYIGGSDVDYIAA